MTTFKMAAYYQTGCAVCQHSSTSVDRPSYLRSDFVTMTSRSPRGSHGDMCIPRDMCIPPISLPVKCVSPTPTPPNKCRFYFCCFCEFCESSSKGLQMIQDYEQHNRQKSNDSRQNNRKAVSGEFTSSWAAMLM